MIHNGVNIALVQIEHAFQSPRAEKAQSSKRDETLQMLRQKLDAKNEVIAELMEENIRSKKEGSSAEFVGAYRKFLRSPDQSKRCPPPGPPDVQDARFSRHWLLRPMDFCNGSEQMLACEGREKRTQALRGRNLGRDIPADSAPMVRAVSASLCLSGLPFPTPLDAGVDAFKNPSSNRWSVSNRGRRPERTCFAGLIAFTP